MSPLHALALQVLLVAEGRMAYFGPPSAVAPWFASLGYTHEPALHGTVSDWLLDLVCTNYSSADQPAEVRATQHSMTSQQLHAAADSFAAQHSSQGPEQGDAAAAARQPDQDASTRASSKQRLVAGQDTVEDVATGLHGVVHRCEGVATFLHHYAVLVRREWLAATRNPADAAGRLMTIVGVALVTGLAFYSLSGGGDSFQLRLNSMSWELFVLATL